MHPLYPYLRERWNMLFDESPESTIAYDRLTAMINGNKLRYHNLEHIAECLEALDWTFDIADDHTLVQAAIWYHDAVYDPKRKDNEALSADLAADELAKLTIEGKRIDTLAVRRLILATRHTEAQVLADAKLLVDIDLRILGMDYMRYMRYSSAIRQEFAWVPEDHYQSGRTKVLLSFLDREHIYSTDFFREHYEANARKNIANEIAFLSGFQR